MSWIRNLYETYDACENAVGKCTDTESQEEMLLPLGHLLTEPDILITLLNKGELINIEKVKASEKGKKILVCIPCTEDSESRSGRNAIDFPHPLFDKAKFLQTGNYKTNLANWISFLEDNQQNYSVAYSALKAVYDYLSNNSLECDFKRFNIEYNDNLFILFAVNLEQSLESKLWRMEEIWNAWIDYNNDKVNSRNNKDICYITGEENSTYTLKHPKSINRAAGNSKLITGNDDSNFTFRGRFEEAPQAATVGYIASQKAHQTLRWLISKPSCYRCDTQAIVAWAIDKNTEVISFDSDSYGIYSSVSVQTEANKLVQANTTIGNDYAENLKKLLQGYNALNRLKEFKRRVAILSTDAATTGRLSVTYYREFYEDEYQERIIQWHTTCKWHQPYEKDEEGKYIPRYFIGAPSFSHIITAVLGKPRKPNDESYNKLAKKYREQLLHCMFDGEKLPHSLYLAALHRASNPLAFENSNVHSYTARWRDWENVLCSACALTRKYYFDNKKEELEVNLEPERNDRSYLYGRLLAVADKIESHAMFKQGKERDKARATNAIRYMPAFAQRPFRTWKMLFTQQLNPYIQQLDGANWYLNIIQEIMSLFKSGEYECDDALDGKYLLGFFAQRQELRTKQDKNQNNNEGGENNE